MAKKEFKFSFKLLTILWMYIFDVLIYIINDSKNRLLIYQASEKLYANKFALDIFSLLMHSEVSSC